VHDEPGEPADEAAETDVEGELGDGGGQVFEDERLPDDLVGPGLAG